MKVATGTHIGPYEIVGWLGAGGMGEVYRARDARLGREVAIKLLPEAFATDASRLHRFAQEARAAGQLNHPNILVVYDIGTHAGAPYIVSELLEGESLGRVLEGGAQSARKAIDYARQAAEGLAAAHEGGIVHRDVKPDNLFITNDGRVKILDFGIAKLTQPRDDAAPHTGVRTETADGMVVGTVGYMSPEQVRGEAVDARSDIFNVGAILYEMLTGHRAFARETTVETMAAILKEDPENRLSTTGFPALERIVARCLEKAREARFQSARDLAFALECLSGTTATAASGPAITRPIRLWRRALPWGLAGTLGVALTLVLVFRPPSPAVPASAPVVLSAELGGVSLSNSINEVFGHSMSISPQGDVVVFVAEKSTGDSYQLYVLRLNQLQAAPLAGTDGAASPFFSPDGLWIGFFAGGVLKKIAVTGGAAVQLADASASPRGGAWSEDGMIVFSPRQTAGTRLLRVSAAGGKAEPLGSFLEGEVIQAWPQVLPGGKGVLYTGGSVPGGYNDANLMVQPLPGGAPKVIYRGGYHGRYLPSGHLVYIHDGTLFAAPFDLDRLKVTGQSEPALEGVMSNVTTGGAQFAVSANGTLLYRPRPRTRAAVQLNWMDREGNTTPLPIAPANVLNLAFARDGRLAMEIRDGPSDIWIYGDKLRRLTSDPVRAIRPAWTVDGRRIVFASARGDKSTLNLWWQRADGAGDAQRLTNSKNLQQPGSWHSSGDYLAFEEQNPKTSFDLMILPMNGEDASGWRPGEPTVFLNSPAVEVDPAFSPDGRWLAYSSNESGRMEVYARPFPGPGRPSKISTDGGVMPIWSRTKREIFYGHGLDGQIMVAPYAVEGDSLRAEKPSLWSEGRYQFRGPNRMFDLHPDGERFALAPAAPSAGDHVTFVFNFFEKLRGIAPATSR